MCWLQENRHHGEGMRAPHQSDQVKGREAPVIDGHLKEPGLFLKVVSCRPAARFMEGMFHTLTQTRAHTESLNKSWRISSGINVPIKLASKLTQIQR